MTGPRKTQYQALPAASEFWADAASSKTDHALIYLMINEIRTLDLSVSYEHNIATMGKLKGYVSMLDLSSDSTPVLTEEEKEEEKLANKMRNY